MIEILVIIAVVRMFSRLATKKHRNKVVWGIIGAASYYVPIAIVGFGILPDLFINGTIPFDSEMDAQLKATGILLVIGILSCVIAYQYLRKLPSLKPEMEDVIDQ